MEMFLMSLCMTVLILGLAVASVRFGAATQSESSDSVVQPQLPQLNPVVASPTILPRPIPIELLLVQLENHIRLEQAAAESFLAFPSQAQLRQKTASPFVN
jgi:hypothetical protein